MTSPQNQLFTLIRSTRRRRQQLLALRGAALLLVLSAAVLLLCGWLANRYRFDLQVVNYLRVSALLSLLGGGYLFLWRPLRRRVSNRQLARFIEERQPVARDRFVAAVEVVEGDLSATHSWAVTQRLVREADDHAARTNLNEIIPNKRLAAYSATAAACLALFVGTLVWGPPGLLRGFKQLIAPVNLATVDGEAQSISVTPGGARVPRGSDQQIRAKLTHINSDAVTLFTRVVEGEETGDETTDTRWQGQIMETAKNEGEFQFIIFNIQNSTEYFIEAGGVRSETYRLDVVDVPFVKQLDLTLNFPAYTRLAAKTIEDGGEVAAVKGTMVRILAKLTGRVKAARLVVADKRKIEMRAEGETDFSGSLTVAGESSYYIELTSVDGEVYRGSNEHDIVPLEDQAPTVSFEKPGRDMRATNLEEVFTQVKAEDDYGVSSVEMYFSVNGQAEQKVNLQQLSRDAESNALRGTHTFFMEEFGLKPGDFVSYYAKARDASREATSDIYFIEVKPFEMQYKQAQQQPGGGGGGGGEDQNALTKRQKDLIAATFRLLREGNNYTAEERNANFGAIAQGQEKLRGDTNNFIDRLRRRLGNQLEGEEQVTAMISHLEQAAREMEGALPPLQKQQGRDALPPEQRALQQLLSADSILREMQVANSNQSEGGGGESRDQSQELAQLFELELDKMKNQYETLRREQRQQQQQPSSSGGKSEVERKLEELARRQQKMMEEQQRRRQSARAQNNSGGGGGGGRQQQELIEETRKTARELERLSRERRDQKLQEMSRQLNQAADEMQRAQAAASQGEQNGQSAEQQSRRALEKLEQARRRMQNSRQSGTAQDVGDLRQRAAEAAARQREIARDLDNLSRQNGQSGEAQQAKQQLAERKDALADAVKNLEGDLEETARSAGDGNQKGNQQIKDAASQMRRNQLSEQIKRNNENIERGQYGIAKGNERAVQQSLDQLAERLRNAEQSAKNRTGAGGEEALDRTRQLADDLESLKRRLDENARRSNSQNGQQARGQKQNQQRGQQGEQSGEAREQGNSEGRSEQRQQQAATRDSNQGGNEDSRVGSNERSEGGDDRQVWGELRERLREAQDLRQQFGREGGGSASNRDLDRAVRQLEELTARGQMEGEAQTAALLKAQVIEPLRQIELELSRRQASKNGERTFTLGDEGTAPERYRKDVEEYYKSLSNRAARKRS